MAVLGAYPGLTTEIVVNKQPLTEFNDDEAEITSTEVTKYIEARSGADFMIKTTFSKPFPTTNGVEINVTVDGNRSPRWAIKPDDRFYRSANKMTGVSFTQDGKRYHQNYQFADLKVVEEADEPLDFQKLRKEVELKGCIEVSYRWITNFSARVKPEKCGNSQKASEHTQEREDEYADVPMPRRQLPSVGAIPEKALKGDARSHQAILGEPKARKAAKGPSSTYDYVDRDPFGIMRFNYRSSAALKALRVIVDSEPEPEPESEPTHVAEPPMAGDGRRKLARPSQRTERRAKTLNQEILPQRMKQEEEAPDRVKREYYAQEDGQEGSDDLIIVETRSCKRPRADHGVIVLD